jgi:subtilisin family serine protease
MERTRGRAEITIGLIDGPVDLGHPGLEGGQVRDISPDRTAGCRRPNGAACVHGTFVAGMLCGKRGYGAPAICPGCPLLVRPLFRDAIPGDERPGATSAELAEALVDCVRAGASVVNLSLALTQPSASGQRELSAALDYAMTQGTLVVAASGNQGTVGGSLLTRHPWVIPVIACDHQGRPLGQSNLGSCIGRRGLSAPGAQITSLGMAGGLSTSGGTSVAAPFVAGAVALLWSEYPAAPAFHIKCALTSTPALRRATVVPALLDAWAAYQLMRMARF